MAPLKGRPWCDPIIIFSERHSECRTRSHPVFKLITSFESRIGVPVVGEELDVFHPVSWAVCHSSGVDRLLALTCSIKAMAGATFLVNVRRSYDFRCMAAL